MSYSMQNRSSKLGAAMVALTLASTLAPKALAQCVSGNSSTHAYGALNADLLSIPGLDGEVAQFQNPLKVVAGPDGVYVLDGGTPKLVKISVTTDPTTGAQLATPAWTKTLVAPPVDMLPSGTAGARMLYATGREAGIVLISPSTTPGGSAQSTWSVKVTDQTPVAIVNAGGYDWVTDGSNVLYRVTLPTYVASVNITPTGPQTPTLQGTASVTKIPFDYPNASLGAMAYDGLNLWVVVNGTILARVDPSTGQMVNYLPNVGHPDTLAFDGTFLWTGDNSGVRKIDPVAFQQILDHPASLPGPVTGLYIDGSWVWAANGSATLPRARTCDAATLGGITLPANAQTVTAAAGALWITYANSAVVSVR